METLTLHIEYLLTRHDCVIVPGIGAFIATDTEASIDFDHGIISPRRREISFNGSVVTDDGLLSHSIARREHLSYEEAHCQLAAMTDKLRNDLQKEGEISLGMIGRLDMDSEGFITFQPRRSPIVSDIRPSITIFTPEAANTDNSDTSEFTDVCDNRNDSDYYIIRINKKFAHAAAMLIMVLTIGISLLIPINHDNEQKASVVPLPSFILPTAPDDTISTTPVKSELPELPEESDK